MYIIYEVVWTGKCEKSAIKKKTTKKCPEIEEKL